VNVSEKEIQKEMREHPWASREVAMRIALDHKRYKTTTKEGKRIYMREFMRKKRQQLKIPSTQAALGLKKSPDLLSLITGKRRK
jgi:hypothetical protein